MGKFEKFKKRIYLFGNLRISQIARSMITNNNTQYLDYMVISQKNIFCDVFEKFEPDSRWDYERSPEIVGDSKYNLDVWVLRKNDQGQI